MIPVVTAPLLISGELIVDSSSELVVSLESSVALAPLEVSSVIANHGYKYYNITLIPAHI